MKLLTSAVRLPSGANIVNDLSNIIEVFSQCEDALLSQEQAISQTPLSRQVLLYLNDLV
jgi:hypothetical protein